MSKRALFPLACALLLAGCGPNWVKPGTSVPMRDAALARCRAIAFQRAPAAMTTVMSSPGSYKTDKNTKKSTYTPPSYYTSDANSDGRDAIIHDCMYSDGWTPM